MKNLRGDNDLVQSRGGIWSYMETNGMNDFSMVGMQADGKLSRLVFIVETMCKEGKTPTPELMKSVSGVIGQGRDIMNMSPERSPLDKIMESIKSLNENADKLIAKIDG
ncbi:MAG: hypothetical protein G3M78_13490 [Candidatus Nitrohelix vancouverensis]|uniref:Uncharacterized protein n=1 Tax=Candidatus Nitrohelix vancouverensis TaxID=2705534 RepID=A0A7T0C4K1_9BACT|nr:MAG: hypothetical protein G3M78_13490 [Candidatus Nitrohelix vancouverensis]